MRSRVAALALLLVIGFSSATEAKKINDRWSVNFSERFRLVSWDNAISLDETVDASRTFTRHRSQFGAVWTGSENVGFGLQFANEFRYHVNPTTVDFNFDEIFVDQLYVTLTSPMDQPVTITLGRQNIILGEGFVVMDGHPLDGSRSIYFNAARLDWRPKTGHELTAFASYTKETDELLPVVNKRDQALVEQPEPGMGLYYSGVWSGKDVHAYVVHKRREENSSRPFAAEVTAVGSRLKLPLSHSIDLSLVTEAAYQFGKIEDVDCSAYGGYSYLRYKPAWPVGRFFLPTSVTTRFIYLSGDDPGTADYEGWDPMFARWPKWSESYIYTQVKEAAVAWWTNLISLNVEAQFGLTSRVDLQFNYHHLLAAEKPDPSLDFPGGTGTTRGDLFIGKLTYVFDQYWSGHVLWEGFVPGDFYFEDADSYAWIRAELMYRY
ncbi:alginate export family protein [bacterium]|nr:alginate export family protein [bacterium]